jgi:hypothetical protein
MTDIEFNEWITKHNPFRKDGKRSAYDLNKDNFISKIKECLEL